MRATKTLLAEYPFPEINRKSLTSLQVNLGYLCNQSCLHCHVNAGPNRKELMSRQTIDQLIQLIDKKGIQTLDLTGGAPELNPHFCYLVKSARKMGVKVIDRCNLTVIFESGQEDLPDFLAEQGVDIIASMPCYQIENVDRQRGYGVFDKSIRALQLLNQRGYGGEDGLVLNLVYNPQGPVLPPDQNQLEQEYRQSLSKSYGIRFNHLFTLTNMPVQRFGSTLVSTGKLNTYMQLLRNSYQEDNLENLMCREMINVDWQGYLYDCDFNQMLGLSLRNGGHHPAHLRDWLERDFAGHRIRVAEHCYGCTAGQGSSCGGALS